MMSSARRFLKYLIFFGVLLFFTVPIQIGFNGYNLIISWVFILSLFAIRTFDLMRLGKANINFVLVSMIFLAQFAFFSICGVTGGYGDFELVKYPISAFLIYWGSDMLAIWANNHHLNLERIFFFLLLMAVINSIFAITAYFYIDFADIFHSWILLSERAASGLKFKTHSSGLFFSGFSLLSLFYVFSLMPYLATVLTKKGNEFYYKGFFIVLCVPFISLGLILSGRTGFVVLLAGLLLLLVFALLEKRCTHYFIILMANAFIFSILTIVLYYSDFQKQIVWFFEYAFNNMNTATTDAVFSQMYFLPETTWDVLFGTGLFGKTPTLPQVPSDVGYVLVIHYAGLLGLLFTVLSIISIFYINFKKVKAKEVKYLFFFYLLALGIGNMKDMFFFFNNGITQIIFIVMSFSVHLNKDPWHGKIQTGKD